MSQKSNYRLLVQPEWSPDRLLKVLEATAADGFYDITLVVLGSARSLDRVNDYFELRQLSNRLGLIFSFSGGTRMMQDMARAMGFRIVGPATDGSAPAFNSGSRHSQAEHPPASLETSILLALATIKSLLISKGVFSEEEYQEMLEFVEEQWHGKSG